MLRVEKLETRGLAPVSFSLEKGACLAVQGPSGVGKTVLLRAIADLDPAEGSIYWEDVERQQMPAPAWRKIVRYCPAEPGWWAETPGEHFADGDQAETLTAELGLDPALLGRSIADLSTGERQRLALVRAVLDHPPVLALDEPTAALDGEARERAEALIERHRKTGSAILIVTHDTAQARRLADRLLVLGDGQAILKPL